MRWVVIKVLVDKYKLKKYNLARVMQYYGMDSMVSEYYLKRLEEWNKRSYKVYKNADI